MKIGVTERGDGGIDLSWVNKLDKVDGAIIITKNLTDECIEAILNNQEKLLLHCTCTGLGGSVLEPNVPDYKIQLKQLQKLVERGFDASRVVLRVDPLIPTDKGLKTAQEAFDYAMETIPNIKRVRVSIIDMYPHVRERFTNLGLPLPYGNNFAPGAEHIRMVNDLVRENKKKYPGVSFESCAEGKLISCEQVGCVSQKDVDLLGLTMDDSSAEGYQRKGCLCLSCKTELLTSKHPCKHQCVYCYWKN